MLQGPSDDSARIVAAAAGRRRRRGSLARAGRIALPPPVRARIPSQIELAAIAAMASGGRIHKHKDEIKLQEDQIELQKSIIDNQENRIEEKVQRQPDSEAAGEAAAARRWSEQRRWEAGRCGACEAGRRLAERAREQGEIERCDALAVGTGE